MPMALAIARPVQWVAWCGGAAQCLPPRRRGSMPPPAPWFPPRSAPCRACGSCRAINPRPRSRRSVVAPRFGADPVRFVAQGRQRSTEDGSMRKLRLTKKLQERFLEALADTGSVSTAASVAGTSRTRVYELRKADPTFASAWQDAEEIAVDRLYDQASQ